MKFNTKTRNKSNHYLKQISVRILTTKFIWPWFLRWWLINFGVRPHQLSPQRNLKLINRNKPCRQERFPQRTYTCSCMCCCAHHVRWASQMIYTWNKKEIRLLLITYLISRFTSPTETYVIKAKPLKTNWFTCTCTCIQLWALQLLFLQHRAARSTCIAIPSEDGISVYRSLLLSILVIMICTICTWFVYSVTATGTVDIVPHNWNRIYLHGTTDCRNSTNLRASALDA